MKDHDLEYRDGFACGSTWAADEIEAGGDSVRILADHADQLQQKRFWSPEAVYRATIGFDADWSPAEVAEFWDYRTSNTSPSDRKLRGFVAGALAEYAKQTA